MPFPATGLVAYYKLNESAGATRNDSVGANNLSDHGTVGSSAGKIGNAADFNGSTQYLTAADTTAFQFGTGNFSFSAWANSTTAGVYNAIIEYGDSTVGGAGYTIVFEGSALRFFIGDGTNFVNFYASGSWNDGLWHFIVVTCNRSGNASIYVDNGTPDTSDITSITGSINNSNGLGVGGRYDGGDKLTGSVDEVGIFNVVKSSGDVSSLWNGGAGITYTPAMASGFLLFL